MKAILTSGREIEFTKEQVKKLTYQNVRGNKRYYIAIGDDFRAVEVEITEKCYNDTIKEIITLGKAKNKA